MKNYIFLFKHLSFRLSTIKFDRFTVVFLIFVIAIFLACVGNKISLQDAKQVTISMKRESFVPPPRRIKDVTAILKVTPKSGEFSYVERLQTEAEAVPAKILDQKALWKFYVDRGRAARHLGRSKQAIADLNKASSLLPHGTTDYYRHVAALRVLAQIHDDIGDYETAIKYAKKLVSITPHGKVSAIANYCRLARYQVKSGNLYEAEKAFVLANRRSHLVYKLKGRGAEWRPLVRFNLPWSEGRILLAKGKYQPAEQRFRTALKIIEDYIAAGRGTDYSLIGLTGDSIRDIRDRQLAVAHTDLSVALRLQYQLPESEYHARKAVEQYVNLYGADSGHTVWALRALADIIAEQGRLSEAEALSRAATDIYEGMQVPHNSRALAHARRILADVLVGQSSYQEAISLFELIKKAMGADYAVFEVYFGFNLNFPLALLKDKKPKYALTILEPALRRKQKLLGERHYETAEIRGFYALAYQQLGDIDRALAEYQRAVPVLLNHLSQVLDETTFVTLRDLRRRYILESYIDLLSKIDNAGPKKPSDLDPAAEAFQVAQVARRSTVQRAFSASSARAAANNPALADLARREQDAQQQIAALYGLLSIAMSHVRGDSKRAVAADLHRRINRLHEARTTLLNSIKQEFPSYAELINPTPATVRQVQGKLQPSEVFILIYPAGSETYIWAIPSKGSPQFTVTALNESEVQSSVIFLRKALAPDAQTFGDIPNFDLSQAYELYVKLFQPIEKNLKNAKDLIVVATGPLGQLPFSVLPTDDILLPEEKEELFANYRKVPWLIRKFSITRLPSASSFISLRALSISSPSQKAFIGFGDPIFNKKQLSNEQESSLAAEVVPSGPSKRIYVRGIRVSSAGNLDNEKISSSHLGMLNRLPNTAEEINSIALTLNADLKRDVFLREKASERRVKSMDLSDRRVIAFATHALIPGDLDGLEMPSIALSAPSITGDADDGLLTMEEILRLKLNADWVVLSGCNTGAAEGAGAEAVSGLGRAFFYAGSRALLVSMWPVETNSARKITTGLFRHQQMNPKLSRARALRKSMLELIDGSGLKDHATGQIVASYAHPIFWAPFIIVGESGSNTN